MSTAAPESSSPPTKNDPSGGRKGSIRPTVFFPALAFLAIVVSLSIAFPDRVGDALTSAQETVIGGFGWYYTLLVTAFVIFAIWVAVGRFGDIRLGPDDEEAEYGFLTWFSMLFAAGMGIGLVFWGAAEPLSFFSSPKPGVEGDEVELAQEAMNQTFLHWGLHAWAIYVVVGLALAYAIHRKGRSVSLRWTLEPLLGDRVKGGLGDAIDVVAIVGTIAGVATSLGLGVSQISAGMVYLGWIEEATDPVLVALIVAISIVATISVVSGLDVGIKWLSNINLGMAGVFALCILALGPTLFILRDIVENIGGYLFSIVPNSFDTTAFFGADGQAWQGSWSTFYWGWWMSWAPFVGVFIARISRGRTIREFVAGVLLVPTTVSVIWFSILGGSAIYREIFGSGGLVADDGSVTADAVLFNLVGDLPGGALLAGLAIVLVTIFFVTSSDSGSLVVDMLASGGDTDPPKWSRVMWCTVEGLVAIGLLLAGGLGALQTGAILTALPFSVIMIAMCFAMYKAFKSEYREIRRLNLKARRRVLAEELSDSVTVAVTESVTSDLVDNFDDHFGDQVDSRVDERLSQTGEFPAINAEDSPVNGDRTSDRDHHRTR
ncbi:BCCT family transporter [Nocardioides zeae]|uniref:BCCT family transporter n=1 Tax=Nocardioides imazamoxiresistens TaxID=3231893 RepID=A0ABU3PW22_9ACTN|nr:BCCT family transporter [Nocardioides zeae]MDT9593423.1 BCCT family transporter [Nocardioides zeae]